MVARKHLVHVAPIAMHLHGKPCDTPSVGPQNLLDEISKMELTPIAIQNGLDFLLAIHSSYL